MLSVLRPLITLITLSTDRADHCQAPDPLSRDVLLIIEEAASCPCHWCDFPLLVILAVSHWVQFPVQPFVFCGSH